MKKLHLIMPMGGRGYRFFKDGYSMPKPLIELTGEPATICSAAVTFLITALPVTSPPPTRRS